MLLSTSASNKVINPIIFTKKNFIKPNKTVPHIIALEHLLAMVCKMYYKSSFRIHDYLELFSVKDDYEELRVSFSKKPKRQLPPTGSKKKKVSAPSAQNGQSESKEEEEDEIDGAFQFDNSFSVLERLVSPLNHPFEFGTPG